MERLRTRPGVCLLVLCAWGVWTHGDTDVSCVAMETCVLPCSFQGDTDAAVHWSYTAGDLHVHSYYHYRDQLTHQDQRFRGRTSLFQDLISRGNASLQLTGVKVQDQGRYKCFTSTIRGDKDSFINLKVNAPVTTVHLEQVENRLICSSEGIYPEPGLSWSTNPPSNTTSNSTTTVQQTEQLLYNISSSLMLSHDATDVDYSCTVSSTNRRRVTLRKLASISSSSRETFVLCTDSNASLTNFSLVWRFNRQIVLNRTKVHFTVSEPWRQHVKSVSESGITLQNLSPHQEGTYSCELTDGEETHVTTTVLSIETEPQISVTVVTVVTVLVSGVILAGLVVYYNRKRTQQQQEVEMHEHSNTSAPSNVPALSD